MAPTRIVPEQSIGASHAHRLTIRPPAWKPIPAYCVFTPNDDVCACFGLDSLSLPLPQLASDITLDDARCEAIHEHVAAISHALAEGELLRVRVVRRVYYLPSVATGGGPIIGDILGLQGLAVGVGHTFWGILNDPGTGKALA